MAHEQPEFSELMARVRAGSEDAAWELVEKYADMVFHAVRKRLPDDLRRLFDSDDFAQLAWNSVFRHRSRLERFQTPEDFKAFLMAVANNKVRLQVRRYLQQQRNNLNRERPVEAIVRRAPSGVATPSRVAMVREGWLQLIDGQPPLHQEIIRLRAKGYRSTEIGACVGVNEASVRRILRNILRSAAS